MSIVFSGGGTAGSITSLIAVAEEIQNIRPDIKLYWLAPKGSIGKELVSRTNIEWAEIPAGKLKRYFSWSNFFIPYKIVCGFIAAGTWLKKWQSKVIVTSGSFASPPVVWRARLRNNKIIVLQLDIKPGLSNKLTIPFADKLFVSWQELLKRFPKAQFTGLPLRVGALEPADRKNQEKTLEKPLIMIIGGGTGAQALNELVYQSLDDLTKIARLVHITGKGKMKAVKRDNYYSFEFLARDHLMWLKRATLVVSRAGMGTIGDCIAFGKPVVLIPIPNSHQEENARYLMKKNAAFMWNELALTPRNFYEKLKSLLEDTKKLQLLSRNIYALANPKAAHNIAKGILELYDS